jgi:L-arabinonolactonase
VPARIGGHRIDCYDADGNVLGYLSLPTSHPTHCTFGGSNYRTLFVTTSRFGEEFETGDDADAGYVLGYRVDHSGLPPTRFPLSQDQSTAAKEK